MENLSSVLMEELRPLVREEFEPRDEPLLSSDPKSPYQRIQKICIARLQELGIEKIVGSFERLMKEEAPPDASDVHRQVLVGLLHGNLDLALHRSK